MSPFVQLAIITPLVNLATFPTFALIYSLPLLAPRLAIPKLQRRVAPAGRTARRALALHVFNGLLTLLASMLLWRGALRMHIHCGPLPPLPMAVLQIAAFIVIDDLAFYVLHRALHTPWLYRHVHRLHHRIHAPNAFTGAILHPVEWLLVSASLMLGPLLFGANIKLVWIWVFLRQWGNAEFHSGFVGPFTVLTHLSLGGGTPHHDRHHARVHGNYAIMFPLWDRMLGTELAPTNSASPLWR